MSADSRTPTDRFRTAAALEAQLDADLLDSTERYAGKRVEMLSKAGLWADAEELVQDAIEATLSGDCTWDPDRYSLYYHLCGVIGSRTKAQLKHAQKFPKVRMGGGERDDATNPIETAASLQEQHDDDPETKVINAQRVHYWIDRLRAAVEEKNDHQVLGILEAYAKGITERAEVAAHLGISVKKYDHARVRMLRLAGKLQEGPTDA